VKPADRKDHDYLWDPSTPPDPEIARLEQALAPLAHRGEPPAWPAAPQSADEIARLALWRRFPRRTTLVALAAAVLVAIGVGIWLVPGGDGWEVQILAGAPRIDGELAAGKRRLRPGERLATGDVGRAQLSLQLVGEVDVEPGSEVTLSRSRAGAQRFRLDHGTLEARIWAPPRVFEVDTPAARAIDLGCVYTLSVARGGDGRLAVASGWVALADGARESFVPAGASAALLAGHGPGVPLWDDAPNALRQAVERLDREGDTARRAPWLERALAAARQPDSLTVWHLLARAAPAERPAVADRLAELVPPPPAAPRAAVLAGDRAALDAWWGALELGSASWWRLWRQPMR
jgi:hypothetical protein